MPTFKIEHTTTYKYEVPVRDSANQIMLYAMEDDHQQVIGHRLFITGNPAIETHFDVFNNKIGTFTHSHPHNELVIRSILEVETKPKKEPKDFADHPDQWTVLEGLKYEVPFIDFLRIETFASLAEMQQNINDIHNSKKGPGHAAINFCDYVYKNFTYKKGVTTVDTTLDEILKLRSGVCQDFAHILLAMLRLVGIPARYVSGYICPNKNGMRGEGATHAWVEAYIPEHGWLGLDPTNNCMANEKHVRLAIGKNYYDCSPVRGTYRGTSNHTLNVSVTVGYEDGSSVSREEPVEQPGNEPINSFRRHQEMQQQ